MVVKHRGGKIYGSKITRKAIVPIKHGTINIPSFSLDYFDTEKEKWEHLKTRAIEVKVLKSENQEKLNAISSDVLMPQRKQIKLLGKDIFPIKTSLGAVRHLSASGLFYIIILVVSIFPGLIYLALFLIKKNREKLSKDQSLRRRSVALKNFKKSSRGALVEKSPEKTEMCLREFLGNVFNVNGLATTPLEFREIMLRENVDENLLDTTVKTLENLEGAKFGAYSFKPEDIDSYMKVIKKIVESFKGRYGL